MENDENVVNKKFGSRLEVEKVKIYCEQVVQFSTADQERLRPSEEAESWTALGQDRLWVSSRRKTTFSTLLNGV